MEKIFLAADHAGFELKNKIKNFLTDKGFDVEDKGPFEYNTQDDYPDFISLAAKEVSLNPKFAAIVLGGSGQGEAMVANKYKNVRAAVYYGGNLDIVKLSKEHNNANVLSLGARFLNENEALETVELWLKTKFTNEERHQRRIEKINEL